MLQATPCALHSHMSSETCQRLATRAAHAQQEGVAEGLPDDSRDAAHVLDGIHEEDEPHLGRVDLVVVIQVVFCHLHKLLCNTETDMPPCQPQFSLPSPSLAHGREPTTA